MAHKPNYTSTSSRYAVMNTRDAGYDGYKYSGSFYARSNTGGNGYVSGSVGASNPLFQDTFILQVTQFDNTGGRHGSVSVQFNDQTKQYYSYATGSGTRTPGTGAGVEVGGIKGYSVNASYNGLIGDVILFDEKLTNAEVTLIRNYLNKKYNQKTGCALPDDTTGYDTSSCNATADTTN